MTKEQSERLYETCYMRVFSYAMTLCGDRPQAEEIAQETFTRAMSTKSEFRALSDELTWLCAIAKNYYLSEKRREIHRAELSEEIPDPRRGPEEDVLDRAGSLQVHMVLHGLEEPYREVFELRAFGDLSYREIGQIFGKTENWARVTYYRARVKILERMMKR